MNSANFYSSVSLLPVLVLCFITGPTGNQNLREEESSQKRGSNVGEEGRNRMRNKVRGKKTALIKVRTGY
jgi:hypothetical protein